MAVLQLFEELAIVNHEYPHTSVAPGANDELAIFVSSDRMANDFGQLDS